MAVRQHAHLRGDFAERTFRPRSFSRGVNFLCAWTLLAETSVLGNAFLRPPMDVSASVQLEPHGTAMISHPSALAVLCALLLGGLLPIDMCIGNAARRSVSTVNSSRRSTETSPGSSGSFCGWSSHNKVHFSFVHAFACEALSAQRDWTGFTELFHSSGLPLCALSATVPTRSGSRGDVPTFCMLFIVPLPSLPFPSPVPLASFCSQGANTHRVVNHWRPA